MPPPPPPPTLSSTPHAKPSFPIAQNYRDSLGLANQLRVLDSRWAHLFSVAPVINKLTKGRQRPEEFCKNAETLYEDVRVALDESQTRRALRRRLAATLELDQDQDSIVPGPPPVQAWPVSRVVKKALSSIRELVEPSLSLRSKSPSRTRPRKLKSRRVKKKDSRHSMRSTRQARPKRSNRHSDRDPDTDESRGRESKDYYSHSHSTPTPTRIGQLNTRLGVEAGDVIPIDIVHPQAMMKTDNTDTTIVIMIPRLASLRL
ncbi:hypothetical protein BT96DRAFT_280158 [Gymnopus androsaceus JB14]|uniref:Uncharacterized protein n=1 Tax=Gymnopus androsaceus JB14 TaxID=1447944 RepID=A0A6A4I6A5_9AGAR|nr:hypothetical protein BT96DRAFT_280158 [Gymnopus androsaceus JB14]